MLLKEFTEKTINSILASTNHPFEIIVVDNASTDGSVDYLDSINNNFDNITTDKNQKKLLSCLSCLSQELSDKVKEPIVLTIDEYR